MTQTFRFENTSRKSATLYVIAAVLLAVMGGIVFIDMHWVFAVIIILLCVPALYEYLQGIEYQLMLNDDGMEWHVGRDVVGLNWAQVDKISITTRLDFSPRVTVYTNLGQKLRLHPGVTPPSAVLVQELEKLNIRYERRHFTFLS